MHKCTQSIHWSMIMSVAGCALMISLSGCKEQAVADYNRINIQLLTQAFDAVHQQDHDLAATRLEKIEGDEFITKLVLQEKEKATIKETGELLGKGDVKAAADVIDKGLVACGRTPQLSEAREVVDGLRYIREYQKTLPLQEPDEANRLVNGLPQPKLFKNNVRYVTWLNRQKKNRDALLFKVRQEKAGKLLKAMDKTVLSERGNYGLLLKDLNSVVPDHPLFTSVTSGKAQEGMASEEIEIYRMISFKRNPSTDWSLPITHTSKTSCGRVLVAVGYLKDDKQVEALAILRDVFKEQPKLDPALISQILSLSKIKGRDQSPTVPSLLNLIHSPESK